MARPARAGLTPGEGRRFAFTVGGAFLVLAGVFWWRDHALALRITGGLAGALVLAGLLVPGRLGPVQDAWMALAHAISRVTTPIFMGVVYFLVITPMGVLRRTFGRNPVDHAPEDDSYWMERDPGSRSTMKRQF